MNNNCFGNDKLFGHNNLKTSSSPFRHHNVVTSKKIKELNKAEIDLSEFTPDRIRNFCIIAHIDHGKSTLADYLLKETGTITPEILKDNAQFLDRLQVERERGITVKAQSCAMFYEYKGVRYLLNLIDTPGHVDFNYEVSRSMGACDGCLLLVDSGQGIQAQTLANYFLALEQDLTIIPVITKIDQQTSQPEIVEKEMIKILGCEKEEILKVSAKSGLNCNQILPAVIERVPPPKPLKTSTEKSETPNALKALIFDSWYDEYFGVVSLVYISQGVVEVGDFVYSANNVKSTSKPTKYQVSKLGILNPDQVPVDKLYQGQVGYLICGMKSTKEAQIGDTLYLSDTSIEPLPGFKQARPMVYAGIYPLDSKDFEKLRDVIDKLLLTDRSVTIEKETSAALGTGFRCGFLGLLHMDVFKQRLSQEYTVETIITAPTVTYKVILPNTGKRTSHNTVESEKVLFIDNPNDFPEETEGMEVFEPIANCNIMTPREYVGSIMSLCQERRGVQVNLEYFSEERVSMQYKIPLNEMIYDFFDKLKSATKGYATLDYEEAGYEKSDVVKLTVMLNKDPVDALSYIVHESKAYFKAREVVSKLRKLISRQMFEVSIQCAIGTKVIASEKLKAFRKNVTAKCYGGDITRKRKLLEKQKEGKKKMKQLGSVQVPQEAFTLLFAEGDIDEGDYDD
ncbi:hypothetical protein ABK040_014397 [Willaertia magna]